MLTAIFDIEAGPNQSNESCPPQAWAEHALATKATRLGPSTNTQLEVREVIRPEV